MKKKLSMLLALAMAVTMTGCSGGGREEKASDDVTLIYCVAGNQQADEVEVEAAINEIIQPLIGAKIDLQFIDWAAYKEKMNMKLTAGEYFDIAYGGFDRVTATKNGALMALDDLLEQYAKELKEELPQYMWDAATTDGKIYCVPNYQCMAYPKGVAVRKDLMEKYNFDITKVKKLGDLEPFWQQIRDNEPTLIPYRMQNLETFTADALGEDFAYTGKADSLLYINWDDCKVYTSLDSDVMYKKAKVAYDWMQKGYFRKDIATVADDSSDYASGRYATFSLGYKPGCEAEYKTATGYDYVIQVVGESMVDDTQPTSTTTVMSADTKYPEQAMQFLNLLNTNKDIYNLICFGIEGKHYKWVDDEHIQVDNQSGYCPNSSWEFGNQFNAYVQVGQDVDVWEKTIKQNEDARVTPIMGIKFENSEILTQLTQCKKIQKEYCVARMEKGVTDPDSYWEQYLAELKKAGIEDVKAHYRRTIDEHLEKKK